MAEILNTFRDLHSGKYNKLVIEYNCDQITIEINVNQNINSIYTYSNSKYILVDLTYVEIIKMVINLILLPEEWKSIFLLNEH